jgi:hypothetical protein
MAPKFGANFQKISKKAEFCNEPLMRFARGVRQRTLLIAATHSGV